MCLSFLIDKVVVIIVIKVMESKLWCQLNDLIDIIIYIILYILPRMVSYLVNSVTMKKM